MPITVVGRVSKFAGKSVFQIVSNLKDFGAGRVIYRTAFQRYEEPSYWRLTKVEPTMDEERKLGRAWAETVFRGKNHGVHEMPSPYKADYRLLPKDEEDEFCGRSFQPLKERVLPAYGYMPPLLASMVKEELKSMGITPPSEPQLKMVYKSDPFSRCRGAKDNEDPNATFEHHVSWELYEDVMEKPK